MGGREAGDSTTETSVSKKEIAIEMMTSLLFSGAKQSTEIIDIIKNAGISESTINAAKRLFSK